MVNNDLRDYVISANPFLTQNDFFRRATGLEGDMFTFKDISGYGRNVINDMKEELIIWNYQMPHDGVLYTFSNFQDDAIMLIMDRDNNIQNIIIWREPRITPVGLFSEGTKINFIVKQEDIVLDPELIVGIMDS